VAAVFRDVVEDVDLRTVSSRLDVIKGEEKRVGGLKDGQVISYHNKAGTRFRHYQKIWGRVCLVIPPHDPSDKFSLFLKESELLAKMAPLRKHQKLFDELTEHTQGRKDRSDARLKAMKKNKRKK
jgi:hypothetical protein